MKRRTILLISLVLTMLLLGVLAAVAAGHGHHDLAASPRQLTTPVNSVAHYNITDLGTLGGATTARGINELGQVVGNSGVHAFLWLPDPAYGLPAGMNELGTLGGNVSAAYDINDQGQVAGWANTTGGDRRAFLWLPQPDYDLPAGMNDLGHLGGSTSQAYAINNEGHVAGASSLANGDTHAFRWMNSVMTDLGTLGGSFSLAHGLNDQGQIVGEALVENDDAYHPFLWHGGSMIALPTLGGGEDSAALDINDAGDVVGYSEDPVDQPILWSPTMIELDTLAGGSGLVRAINNSGQMVGSSSDADHQQHAVLWENDTITSLNDLIDPDSGWHLQIAHDINDAGQIVGRGIYDGQVRGFLLTPDAWTVMFYLAADNDLAHTYTPIFNELEMAAHNPHVNVVVLWDGPEDGDSAYYHVQYDLNFTEPADYVEGETKWSQGEVDMGFPTTLSDFATWAMTEFPAQHYALVLDDHGSGLGGGLVDDTSGSSMTLPEMKLALATIHEQTEQKIDVLYMAMCLMGMIEDAYQFRGHADYYVASEHLQWAFHVPYYNYVAGITNTSTPAQVAQIFAGSYANRAETRNHPYTISVVDMAQLDPLAVATQQLGAELDWYMEEISPTLTAVLTDVQRFDNRPPSGITPADTTIDLYHFADLVSLNLLDYGDIVTAGTAVMSAVDDAVIYERHGSTAGTNLDNSHGIAIFFPSNRSSFYHPDNYDFAVGANWDDVNAGAVGIEETAGGGSWGSMLVNYIQLVNPTGPDDSKPPPPRPKLLPETSLFLPLVVR
ncbi:MAG TPA: clostripain-related cysteine peptidase [Candidatus Sulfomarinibacteraceae bacterium]|nr:clostripain-related cysteine peptidase [Candidatus Sulfomarinibacteraceae bacterium]